MAGIKISVINLLPLLLLVHHVTSFDAEPLYKPLELHTNAKIATTEYDDSGPTANELYRYRRQSSVTTPPPPGWPTPSEVFNLTDSHSYYNSVFYSHGQEYFIDLDTDDRKKVIHTALSDSHLTAGEVNLPFPFRFYGHNITKIYIATGGFISLSTFFHQYLSATQYIAPLMGNFDPSLNGSSQIQYAYNSTSFTVEWDDIHIQHLQEVGRFTFQATLMLDGRIIFAYKVIPANINGIGGGNGHKVTIGLSDGYYIDQPLYPGSFLVKRTIYHYHNVYLNKTIVTSNSAYVLNPLTTCNILGTCSDCLGQREAIRFDCAWCSELRRCSDGLDRHRQEWVENGCPEDAQEKCSNNDSAITAAVVIVVLIVVFLCLAGFGCVVYAYKNPSSRSGQQLIQVQQRLRVGIRRNPQDNYQESIVANMQDSKPMPPPAYTPPSSNQDSPSIPTPPLSITPPLAGATDADGLTETPVVITTGGSPGAVYTGNGDAVTPSQGSLKVDGNANASMSDC